MPHKSYKKRSKSGIDMNSKIEKLYEDLGVKSVVKGNGYEYINLEDELTIDEFKEIMKKYKAKRLFSSPDLGAGARSEGYKLGEIEIIGDFAKNSYNDPYKTKSLTIRY